MQSGLLHLRFQRLLSRTLSEGQRARMRFASLLPNSSYTPISKDQIHVESKINRRFNELAEELDRVAETKHTYRSQMTGSFENVDENALLEWCVKAKNIIVKVCGEDSQHFKAFTKAEGSSSWSGTYSKFKALKSVFLATKEDFEGGYLSSYKSLVQAEVFDTELEQAAELLRHGYFAAASVIAGVVLETALRELCDREGIAHGKLDKMNADLAKAGVYNKIVQKRITALAGLRNSAAHGSREEFTRDDVAQMIESVSQFLGNYLDG